MSYNPDDILEAAVSWWWSYPSRIQSTAVEQDLVTVVREEDNAAN